MKNKSLTFIKDTSYILTSALPFAFSVGICSGMGAFAGAVFACIAALIAINIEQKKQMPLYIAFLIITYVFKEFGISNALLAVAVSMILLLISLFFKEKIKSIFSSDSPSPPAMMLAGALTVTVLITTLYFGIGAKGNTVREMIASYMSLGFHPNWRGILYGTIVMVVMITFPRKFKKFNQTVRAPFIALILTTALNFLLNPSDMITAIAETGAISFEIFNNTLIAPISTSEISFTNALYCGIALFLPCFCIIDDKDNVQKEKYCISNKLTASILTALLFFALQGFFARTPVASCAVILIVGAWNSVNWSELKKAFASPLKIACFAAIIVLCLLLGIVNGTLIAAIVSMLYSLFNSKKTKDF